MLVLSNKADALGLVRAKEAGIATKVISHKGFASREDFDAVITGALKEARVDLVCNAGFMRLHSAAFVRAVVRAAAQHPPFASACLSGPSPAGSALLKAGVRVSGATVHFVSEEMDAGPIIAQGAVPVLAGDDEEALSARILAHGAQALPAGAEACGERRRMAGKWPRGIRERRSQSVPLASDMTDCGVSEILPVTPKG